jgi:peptidyl-prolyl cis-trans isomerase D
MIRFLQKDNRFVKAVFIIIISVACITMVITLIPGIFNDQVSGQNTYATIGYGGVFGRFLPATDEIPMSDVQQLAARVVQRNGYPDFAMQFLIPQVGQSLIQQHIEIAEAHRMGVDATDGDVRAFLHTGMWGQVLFPHGQYIGDQAYAQLVSENFGLSREKFEAEVKKQIEANRLRDLITGAVTVSPSEVRDYYRNQGTKIKFTYAVLSADTLRKTINPTDTELQAFFKQNAAKYAHAIPETRSIQYIAFSDSQIPGGEPKISDQEIQQYYQQHLQQFKVDDEVKVRHILIQVPQNAPPAADAAAKAKAQGILDQLKADHGANFAELAKKYSDDPGSKDQGGELGWLKHGTTVPEFDKEAFSLQPGQISGLVRTQYGYHILQVEDKHSAHVQPLDEVKAQILSTLTQQKEQQAAQAYAQQLAQEAAKTGLQQTAAAHHLSVTTQPSVQQGANLPNVADSSKLVAAAFTAKKGAAPQVAGTGDGFAVFQVTGETPAHAPDFASYKDHILEDYRDDRLPSLLAQKTHELADRAHADNDLTKVAKDLGATVLTSDLVGRTDQVPEVGQLQQVAPALFDLSVGQISSAIDTGRSGVVAKIVDKQEPSAADIQQHFDATREQLLSQQRDQMYAVFLSHLEQTYEKEGRIRINRKMSALPGSNSQS